MCIENKIDVQNLISTNYTNCSLDFAEFILICTIFEFQDRDFFLCDKVKEYFDAEIHKEFYDI